METLRLFPLSQDEILQKPSSFLSHLHSGKPFQNRHCSWEDFIQAVAIGGYPESLRRKTAVRRSKWFDSYLDSLIQRDIRDLMNIEGLTQIPKILHLIGSRVGSLSNVSEISRLSGVKHTTLQRYMALLENTFLIVPLPAWTPNLEGAFVKSPKWYLNDTGLLCHLRGEDHESLAECRMHAGVFLENYVILEILKQLSWSNRFIKAFHFSMHKGAEVDCVLEDGKKRLYGIEIKSSSSLSKQDFKGLKHLAEISPKFQRGIVLYTGEEYLRFGERLHAVPISALWSGE